MKNIVIGLIIGAIIGILISAYFVNSYTFGKIVYTKITLAAGVTGLLCGLYSNYASRPFNLFLGCLPIGALVFYFKYLLTGHDFDPVNMGTLTGAIIGLLFYIMKKVNKPRRLAKTY